MPLDFVMESLHAHQKKKMVGTKMWGSCNQIIILFPYVFHMSGPHSVSFGTFHENMESNYRKPFIPRFPLVFKWASWWAWVGRSKLVSCNNKLCSNSWLAFVTDLSASIAWSGDRCCVGVEYIVDQKSECYQLGIFKSRDMKCVCKLCISVFMCARVRGLKKNAFQPRIGHQQFQSNRSVENGTLHVKHTVA